MEINVFEMAEEQIFEVVDKIIVAKSGIMIFDGPSGSGKTWLLNQVFKRVDKGRAFSYESFLEIYLDEIKSNTAADCVIDNMVRFLNAYKVVGIEEVDFLKGKENTQNAIAEFVNIAAENTLIIFTGINVKRRIPEFFNKLKEADIIYFKRKEK